MTTSKAEEDILKTYGLGVNWFIVKPATFDSLVDLVRELEKYRFQIVELPNSSIVCSIGLKRLTATASEFLKL